MDAVSDVEGGSEFAQGGFLRAGAGDGEPGVLWECGEGVEQGWIVLERDEAADGQPLECAREGDWGRRETGERDAVGQDGELGWRRHAMGEQRLSHGVADGCEPLRQPGGEAIKETTAELARSRAVEGIDDNRDWGDEANEAGEKGGRGEVRVDDLRAVAAMPAKITEPTAGIDPSATHLKGEQFNSRGAKVCGDIAPGAEEDDYGDGVMTLSQPVGEMEKLALRSTNLVEAMDQEGDAAHRVAPRARLASRCS